MTRPSKFLPVEINLADVIEYWETIMNSRTKAGSLCPDILNTVKMRMQKMPKWPHPGKKVTFFRSLFSSEKSEFQMGFEPTTLRGGWLVASLICFNVTA